MLDTSGNLYIADQGNRRIREVAAIGAAPPPPPGAVSVGGVAVEPDLRPDGFTGATSDSGNAARTAWLFVAAMAATGALGISALAMIRRRKS